MTKVVSWLLLIYFVGLLAWSVACEPEGVTRTFTFVNGTPSTVTVYMNGREQFDLTPGQTLRTRVFVHPKYLFEARDQNGKLLFRLETTEEQLAQESWTIEIRDQTRTMAPSPS